MKTALFSTLLFGLVSTPVHNDRVTVAEAVIQPGAIETWSGASPSVIVYLTDGSVGDSRFLAGGGGTVPCEER